MTRARACTSAGLTIAAAGLIAGGCAEGRQPADEPVQVRTATPSREEVLTVRQALKQPAGQKVTVRGALVIEDGRSRLCHLLLDSRPPQCGSVALEVKNLNGDEVDLVEVLGVAWNENVRLSGSVTEGVLEVRDE